MGESSLRASQHTYSLPRIDPYTCKATNGVHSLLASTEFSYGRYPYSVKLTNSVQHPVFASKMEALHCNCMQAVLVRWCGHQRRRLAAKAGARRHRPAQHRSRISKRYGHTFRVKLLARPLLAPPAAPVSACQAGTQGEIGPATCTLSRASD